MQLRECFARAKPFQLKMLTEKDMKRRTPDLTGFF